MAWFKRTEKGINTPTEFKKEAPDGLWHQCPDCKKVVQTKEHQQNAYTCPSCGYHDRIGSAEYFEVLWFHLSSSEKYANSRSSKTLSLLKFSVQKGPSL